MSNGLSILEGLTTKVRNFPAEMKVELYSIITENLTIVLGMQL